MTARDFAGERKSYLFAPFRFAPKRGFFVFSVKTNPIHLRVFRQAYSAKNVFSCKRKHYFIIFLTNSRFFRKCHTNHHAEIQLFAFVAQWLNHKEENDMMEDVIVQGDFRITFIERDGELLVKIQAEHGIAIYPKSDNTVIIANERQSKSTQST